MKSNSVTTITIKRTLAVVALIMCTIAANAQQNRNYIKQNIKEWGACRNVAITKRNGDIAMNGRNVCAWSSIPKALENDIRELNKKDEYIDDIQLTENGKYILLWGDNGFRWNDIPSSLESKIREYNRAQEVVTSVTFNDSGDWIVITTEHIKSSSKEIDNWLKDGLDRHGKLWAACVTDDAMVAVYENGYKFFGNVPETLREALKNTKLDVYRLKIAGNSWFFADKNGEYEYNM